MENLSKKQKIIFGTLIGLMLFTITYYFMRSTVKITVKTFIM